jgi:hypothetical protein
MLRFLFVITATCCFFTAFAQPKADVTIGPVLKFNAKRETISAIIGEYSGTMVALRSGGKMAAIDGYDAKGNFKYSNPISLEFQEETFKREAIIGLRNNLLLFASRYDKKADKNTLIACILDINGKVVKPFSVIDEIVADKKRNSGDFHIAIADDSTKVLVYHDEPYEKEGMEKVQYMLIDENLNKLWTKALELPARDRESALKDFAVDNHGNVFIVSRMNQRAKERSEPNTYHVYGYLYESDKITDFELKLDNKYLEDPNILFDRSGELIISGFYKTDWRKGIDGLFYVRINPENQEIIAKNYKDFSKELLTVFLGEKKAEKADKKDRGLSSFVLRNVIRRADGGIMLVAEQYYVVVVETRDPKTGAVTRTYHYYYNDLLVANVAPSGSIDWYARIPKRQHSVNDGGYFSSFNVAAKGDRVYFIFNDNLKNFEPDADMSNPKQLNNFKKAIVALYALSPDGKIERAPLFTNKGQGVILRPKVANQNTPSSVTVFGERGKSFNFVKIDL